MRQLLFRLNISRRKLGSASGGTSVQMTHMATGDRKASYDFSPKASSSWLMVWRERTSRGKLARQSFYRPWKRGAFTKLLPRNKNYFNNYKIQEKRNWDFFNNFGDFQPLPPGVKNAFAAKRFRKRGGEKKENPIIVIVCPNQQLEDSSSFWKQLF